MKTILLLLILVVFVSCKNELIENNFERTAWEAADTILMTEIGGECAMQLDFYSYSSGQVVSIQKNTSQHSGTCVYITPIQYRFCNNCITWFTENETISAVLLNDTLLVTQSGVVYTKIW